MADSSESDGNCTGSSVEILSCTEFQTKIGREVSIGVFAKMVKSPEYSPCSGGKFVTLQLLMQESRKNNILVELCDGVNSQGVILEQGAQPMGFIPRLSVVAVKGLKYNKQQHLFTAVEITELLSANSYNMPILVGNRPPVAPEQPPKRANADHGASLPDAKRQNVATDSPFLLFSDVPDSHYSGVLKDDPIESDTDAAKVSSTSPDIASLLGSDMQYFSRLTPLSCVAEVTDGMSQFCVGPVKISIQEPFKENQPWRIIAQDMDGHSLLYKVFKVTENDIYARFTDGSFYFFGNGEPAFSNYSKAVEVMFSLTMQSGNRRHLIIREVPKRHHAMLSVLFKDVAPCAQSSSSAPVVATAEPLSIEDYLSREKLPGRKDTERGLAVKGVLSEVSALLSTKAGKPYRNIKIMQRRDVQLSVNVWSSSELLLQKLKQEFGDDAHLATASDARAVILRGLTIDHAKERYQTNISNDATIEFLSGSAASSTMAVDAPSSFLRAPAPLMTLSQALSQPQDTRFDLLVLLPACSEARPKKRADGSGSYFVYELNAFDNSGEDGHRCVNFKLFQNSPLVRTVRQSGTELKPVFADGDQTPAEGIVQCTDPAKVVVAYLRNYKLFVPDDSSSSSAHAFNGVVEVKRYLVRDKDSSEEVLSHGDPRAVALVDWYQNRGGHTFFVPNLANFVRRSPEEYFKQIEEARMISGVATDVISSSSSGRVGDSVACATVTTKDDEKSAQTRGKFANFLRNMKK